MQSEEDRKNIIILQESLDKLNEKIKMYKRQLEEQECLSNSNIMRVKKFQRDLEAAESRALDAESTLDSFRYKKQSNQINFSAIVPFMVYLEYECVLVATLQICHVPLH